MLTFALDFFSWRFQLSVVKKYSTQSTVKKSFGTKNFKFSTVVKIKFHFILSKKNESWNFSIFFLGGLLSLNWKNLITQILFWCFQNFISVKLCFKICQNIELGILWTWNSRQIEWVKFWLYFLSFKLSVNYICEVAKKTRHFFTWNIYFNRMWLKLNSAYSDKTNHVSSVNDKKYQHLIQFLFIKN